jgi:hypothetical protein
MQRSLTTLTPLSTASQWFVGHSQVAVREPLEIARFLADWLRLAAFGCPPAGQLRNAAWAQR